MKELFKILWFCLTLAIVLCYSTLLLAANINCTLVKTEIEKDICSSDIILKLDSEMANIYDSTLLEAEDPILVKQEQKNWLNKSRNACKASKCLISAYKKRIAELKAVKKFVWKVFRDDKLGIEFEHPSNRTVQVDYMHRTISIRGYDMQTSDYIINFEMHDGDFDKTNSESGIFEKKDDHWIAAIGRFKTPPAQEISGQGWHGVKTIITCGISDSKTGFHAAGGQCLWAIISNGKYSIIADTQGVIGTDDLTERSLLSMKFL